MTGIFSLAFVVVALGQTAPEPADANLVQAFFKDHCVRCHNAKVQKGKFALDGLGPKIEGHRSSYTAILERLREREMPPKSEPQPDAALVRRVVDRIQTGLSAQRDSHWAFQPVIRPPVPKIQGASHPIDAFILQKLSGQGLAPSQEAPKETLLRRLSLDLIGLPPPTAEVDAFLADTSADAYLKQVDRLLASPHFGERWGRHWLDLARFAESDGYENDKLRPHAWRYRDWVVAAINKDMPFDQFTIEQLAGDLLPNATADQFIAAGLHRHTLWNSAMSADQEEFRTLAIKDRVETTAAAWMGLTMGCAKCHSHKYDPISQREYYQVYAFFNNTDHKDISLPGGGAAMTLVQTRRATHVHKRGNFLDKGDEVNPGTPAFLPELALEPQKNGSTNKGNRPNADRLHLARWLIDPKHPLTARVAVNRDWQILFGQGLVGTPENFGKSGQPPSHPELLDWLADEFVRLKWSRKALLKTIVTSATYRQSSTHRPEVAKIDPTNALLARQNRFRVEAEIVRDLALAVSGLLDPKLGGPSIVPPFPEGLLAQNFQSEELRLPTKEHYRRGIYIHVQRTLTHPLLAVFDAADGNQPCVKRDRSTTPMQALTLLNDPVFSEAAQALGSRLRKASSDRDDRLRSAFRLCLGRFPEARELKALADLVEVQQKLGAREEAVWAGIARALINLEEFTTRE